MSVKDWAPGKEYASELQDVASEVVGDGKRPNIFFVSSEGRIILISLDFDVAYEAWVKVSDVAKKVETALEDRQTGVIASVEPLEDRGGELVWMDDSATFGYR